MNIDNNLLNQYIDENGNVKYSQLKNDPWLEKQINQLKNAKTGDMNKDQKLAFWLNTYNLLTIKIILNKLEDNPNWKGVTSIWSKIKFFVFSIHKVAGRYLCLWWIENIIIRRRFNDPRIHFALNCGNKSCPYLPGKLFNGENLNEYLNKLTSEFINSQGGVKVQGESIKLNKIFKWYSKDFGGEKGIIEFIRGYWNGKEIPKDPKITYMEYNWELNKQ